MLQLKHKWISNVLFGAYCVFIVWYTLFTRKASLTHSIDMRFMWSYREMLAGDINWKKDVIQNLLNIAFFVPFGIFFPLKKWIVILISACAFSVLIEAAQYFFRLGLCELDDVICNTLGAMIGFWLLIGVKKIVRKTHEA